MLESDMQQKTVRVQIQFKTEADGGRATAANLRSGVYRPHLRVSGGEYLGVVLCNGPADAVTPGESACADAVLIYEPAVDYSALTPGVEFDVLEGRQVVGTGKALT
jgi:hypothetical protein